MIAQTQLRFPVYRKQNNAGSQTILDNNILHLSKQCQLVHDGLCQGIHWTTTLALKYGIGDLRARIRDLIKAGVPVQKKLIKGRYKEYFL